MAYQEDDLPLDTALADRSDDLPYAPPAEAAPRQPTTLLDVAAAPFKRAGSEIAGGTREALLGEPSPGGDMLSSVLRHVLGFATGHAAAPESPELSAITNRVSGAGRVLGAGAAGFGAGLGKATRYAGEKLGVPENILGYAEPIAEFGGTLLAPGAVTNAPLRLMRGAVTAPIRPIIKGMQELTASEKVAAEARAAAEATAAAAHAKLAQSTAELDSATNNLVQQQNGIRTSPFAATLSAPVTNREAYSFIEALKPGSTPSIPLTKTQETAQKIIDEFAGTPASLAPAKGIKTAGALIPEKLPEEIQAVASKFSPEELEGQAAYAPLLKMIKAHNEVGGIAPDKLTAFKSSLGEFSQTTGGSIIGRRLYRSLMDDVRESAKTNPAARQYLRAADTASQNLAAAEIADKITFSGTSVNPTTGRLVIKPGAIETAVAKDELLNQLPPEQKQRFIDTIKDVYRLRGNVAEAQAGVKEANKGIKGLPEIISPKVKAGVFSRNIAGAAGATLGGAAGAATGIPHLGFGGVIAGFHGGANAADKAYQMIFQIALRPGGRQFLQTLYGDLPPIAGDVSKLAALQSFLQSSGRPQ